VIHTASATCPYANRRQTVRTDSGFALKCEDGAIENRTSGDHSFSTTPTESLGITSIVNPGDNLQATQAAKCQIDTAARTERSRPKPFAQRERVQRACIPPRRSPDMVGPHAPGSRGCDFQLLPGRTSQAGYGLAVGLGLKVPGSESEPAPLGRTFIHRFDPPFVALPRDSATPLEYYTSGIGKMPWDGRPRAFGRAN